MQSFSVKDPEEIKTLSFGFSRGLSADDYIILNEVQVTVIVIRGLDPTPETLLSGSPSLSADKRTVYQDIKQGLEDVEYAVRCRIKSNRGSVLVLPGRLYVKDAHEI